MGTEAEVFQIKRFQFSIMVSTLQWEGCKKEVEILQKLRLPCVKTISCMLVPLPITRHNGQGRPFKENVNITIHYVVFFLNYHQRRREGAGDTCPLHNSGFLKCN